MDKDRLKKQIEFISEIDKLKKVIRGSYIHEAERKENSAEHSWHMAVMATILSEYAPQEIDMSKVIKMALIHDIVEVDAGDTYCYDKKGHEDKGKREKKAADRIFNILPEDQAKEFYALWEEFEERSTPESKFAAALDRLQPFLQNFNSKGKAWKEHDISKSQVIWRNKPIGDASIDLWKYVETLIEEGIRNGWLKP